MSNGTPTVWMRHPFHTGVWTVTKTPAQSKSRPEGGSRTDTHTEPTLIPALLRPFLISLPCCSGSWGNQERGLGREQGVEDCHFGYILHNPGLYENPSISGRSSTVRGLEVPGEEGRGWGCMAASRAGPGQAKEEDHPSNWVSLGMGRGCFPYCGPSPY